MAGDTTALAEAILAMREAAAATDAVYRTEPPAGLDFNAARESLAVLIAVEEREQDAGRALLVALDGVPERIAALETLYAHAWNFNGMHDDFTAALDALAALDASRKGAGCGTD